MKLLAAAGIFLGFAVLLGLGIVLAAAKGTIWLLLLGMAAFSAAFIRYGCLHDA